MNKFLGWGPVSAILVLIMFCNIIIPIGNRFRLSIPNLVILIFFTITFSTIFAIVSFFRERGFKRYTAIIGISPLIVLIFGFILHIK